VFYAGPKLTFRRSGNKVARGQAGEVTGPMPGRPDHVAVMFAGNNGNINCRASALGYAPPATAAPPAPAEEEKARPTDAELAVALGLGPPHDVTVGAGAIGVRFKPSSGLGPQVLAVFEHCPCPESFALGACVVAVDGRDARELTPAAMCEYLKHQSAQARTFTLRSPLDEADDEGDEAAAKRAAEAEAAAAAPPPPPAFEDGERVYYVGANQTFASGNKLTHGQAGEVAEGHVNPTHAGVVFAGNATHVNCALSQLSRAPPPPLPGGFAVGEAVFYAGPKLTFRRSGNKVARGQAGEVTGPMPGRPDHVAVMFAGNNGNINCRVSALSYEPVAIAEPPAPAGADAPAPAEADAPAPAESVALAEAVPPSSPKKPFSPRARSLRKSVARLTGMRGFFSGKSGKSLNGDSAPADEGGPEAEAPAASPVSVTSEAEAPPPPVEPVEGDEAEDAADPPRVDAADPADPADPAADPTAPAPHEDETAGAVGDEEGDM